MTTPDERRRTLVQVGAFLKELRGNQSFPGPLRQEAHRLLRHYPTLSEIDQLAEATVREWGGSLLSDAHDPDWLRLYPKGGYEQQDGCAPQPETFAKALEAFMEPVAQHLSPLKFRESFLLGIRELESTLGAPFWLLRREPGNPLVQKRLREYLRVHAALMGLGLNATSSLFRLRNTPIPEFRHQTLFEVVRAGQFGEAIGYVRSVSDGLAGQAAPQVPEDRPGR